MANLKVSALGIIVTFVAVLMETIFIPLIDDNLVTLKASAPDTATNSTLDSTRQLLFLLPLFTVIGGVVASVIAGVVVPSRKM